MTDPWSKFDRRCAAYNADAKGACPNRPRPGSHWCQPCADAMNSTRPVMYSPAGADTTWTDHDIERGTR